MKKLFGILFGLMLCTALSAQVPFFATSPGKNNIYSYTHVCFNPGHNSQGVFIFTNYGVTERFSVGTEFLGGTDWMLHGYNLKYQFLSHEYIEAAFQTTSYFVLFNKYKFIYQNFSLFINGKISGDLGYVTNSYLDVDSEGKASSYQYSFLTYNLGHFTPYLGMTNNWTEKINPDLTLGLGVNLGKLSLYFWGGYLFSEAPLATIGFDYVF